MCDPALFRIFDSDFRILVIMQTVPDRQSVKVKSSGERFAMQKERYEQ
jgi:hypothetical protein